MGSIGISGDLNFSPPGGIPGEGIRELESQALNVAWNFCSL